MHTYFLLFLLSTLIIYSPHSITMDPGELDRLLGIPNGMSYNQRQEYLYGKEMAQEMKTLPFMSIEDRVKRMMRPDKILVESIAIDDVDRMCDAVTSGASINAEIQLGFSTPLFYAITKNHIHCAEKLIDLGANCVWHKNGYSILHASCEHGYEHIAKLLLEKRADPTIQTKYWGENCLHKAAGEGHNTVVQLLLTHPSAYSLQKQRDTFWQKPIDSAYSYGKHATVTLLGGERELSIPPRHIEK